MKIVFFGTPAFAVPTLEALCEAHEVVAVVTQPDRRKNRGHKLAFSAVKEAAIARDLEVLQPENIKEANIPDADMYVVVAYGQIFPERLLKQPKYGCFNVHASLLPKYRGAAPIERAVEADERESGVSIMKMEKGLDTGDVLLFGSMSCVDMKAVNLAEELSLMGARLMLEAIDLVEKEEAVYTPQNHEESTYAKMIKKPDFEYRSELTFRENLQKIRAFGFVRAEVDQKIMKIFEIQKVNGGVFGGDNGELQSGGNSSDSGVGIELQKGVYLEVADGMIEVLELQPPNSKRMPAKAYLLGRNNKAKVDKK